MLDHCIPQITTGPLSLLIHTKGSELGKVTGFKRPAMIAEHFITVLMSTVALRETRIGAFVCWGDWGSRGEEMGERKGNPTFICPHN
jgi:hypothetical protein